VVWEGAGELDAGVVGEGDVADGVDAAGAALGE